MPSPIEMPAGAAEATASGDRGRGRRSVLGLPLPLLVVLPLLGLVLFATATPGIFTIDEDNYLANVLALRHGRVTVPGTEGVTPSLELAWFDPIAIERAEPTSPVPPTIPPLEAFFALPFSGLGQRGFFLMNLLAFLGTLALLYRMVDRLAEKRSTAAAAVAVYAFGGFSIEYAQGAWPHMLSVLLVLGAFFLAGRVREEEGGATAVAAGLLAGLATGVRYQNVVVAAAVGLGILLGTGRRWRASTLYALGVAIPLAACSFVNHARLGIWSPISKGPRYLSIDVSHYFGNRFVEGAWILWTKVVDFSAHPPPPDPTGMPAWMIPDPATNAYVYYGALKKGWAQSTPWVLLALAAMVAVALSRGRGCAGEAALPDDRRRNETRAALVVVALLLGTFAAMGFGRTEGVTFNMRYFHELVPLVVAGGAWALEGLGLAAGRLLGGLVGGIGLYAVLRPLSADLAAWQRLVFRVPVVLAFLLVAVWLLRRRRAARLLLAPLLGASLGWSAAIHLGQDLPASRRAREQKLRWRQEVEAVLPPGPAVIFARGQRAEALGPLLLERDLVLLDPGLDRGATASRLVRDYLGKGRRVFLLLDDLPREEFLRIVPGCRLDRLTTGRPPLAEVTLASASRPATAAPPLLP